MGFREPPHQVAIRNSKIDNRQWQISRRLESSKCSGPCIVVSQRYGVRSRHTAYSVPYSAVALHYSFFTSFLS
jgi:hypothetical protein